MLTSPQLFHNESDARQSFVISFSRMGRPSFEHRAAGTVEVMYDGISRGWIAPIWVHDRPDHL